MSTQELAARLTDHLQRELAPDAAFKPERFPILASIIAQSALGLAWPDLATATEMAAWVYAVDDLIDGRQLPPAELRRRLHSYVRRRGGDDALGRRLMEIDRQLSRHENYRHLAGDWNRALKMMLEAMYFEAEQGAVFAAGGPAPSSEVHLSQGAHSSGLPVTALTLWILQDRPETKAWIHELWPFLLEAGKALRLNNDLMTAAKEEEEQVLNLVLCRAREAQRQDSGLSREQALQAAREWARTGVVESLGRVREMLQRLPEPDHPAAQVVWRLTQICLHTPSEAHYLAWSRDMQPREISQQDAQKREVQPL